MFVIHKTPTGDYNEDLKNKIADCVGDEICILHSGEGGIFPTGEGDDYCNINNLDFFSLLHKHCNETGFPPNKLNLWWGNTNTQELYDLWCERNNPIERFKSVNYHPLWLNICLDKHDDHSANYDYGKDNKKPKLFTFFCGFPRDHRIKTINFLYENNLLDKIEWTWVSTLEEHDCNKDLPLAIQKVLPKSYEGHSSILQKSTSTNPGKTFFKSYYDTYFDLVTETNYENDVIAYEEFDWWEPVFFSEKTWRSIVNKRPFMLIGNKNSLKELQRLGFKTFPNVFDETYDYLDSDKRIEAILNQLTNLNLNNLYEKIYTDETEEILNHNYDLARYIIEQEQDIYPGNNTEYTHIYE